MCVSLARLLCCIALVLVVRASHAPPEIAFRCHRYQGETRPLVSVYMPELRDATDLWLSFAAPRDYTAAGHHDSTYQWRLPHASLYLFNGTGAGRHHLEQRVTASQSILRAVFWATVRGIRVRLNAQIATSASAAFIDRLGSSTQFPPHPGPLPEGVLFLGPHSLLWETYGSLTLGSQDLVLRPKGQPIPPRLIESDDALALPCDRTVYRIRLATGANARGQTYPGCATQGVHIEGHTYHLVVDLESPRSYLPARLYVQFYDHRRQLRPLGVGRTPSALVMQLPDGRPFTLAPSQDMFHAMLDNDAVVLGSNVLLPSNGGGPTITVEDGGRRYWLSYGTREVYPLPTLVGVILAILLIGLGIGVLHWVTSDYGHLAALLWDQTRRQQRPNRLALTHPWVAAGIEIAAFLVFATAVILSVWGLPTRWWDAWGVLLGLGLLALVLFIPTFVYSKPERSPNHVSHALHVIRLGIHGQILIFGVLATLFPTLGSYLGAALYAIIVLGGLLYFVFLLQIYAYLNWDPPSGGSFWREWRDWTVWVAYGIALLLTTAVYSVVIFGMGLPRALNVHNVQYSWLSLVTLTTVLFFGVVALSTYLLFRSVRTYANTLVSSSSSTTAAAVKPKTA